MEVQRAEGKTWRRRDETERLNTAEQFVVMRREFRIKTSKHFHHCCKYMGYYCIYCAKDLLIHIIWPKITAISKYFNP